jgi:hypothetical protein
MEAGDRDGTTPLMTAVLTGRNLAAQLLLKNGASDRRRDYSGNKALDYSIASTFEKKLSEYRLAGFPQVTEKQRRRRSAIARILRYPAYLRSMWVLHSFFFSPNPPGVFFLLLTQYCFSRHEGKHLYSKSLLYTDGRKLRVLGHHMNFNIGSSKVERTKGFIVSFKNPTVATAATSGWRQPKSKGEDVLDNAKYTRLVRKGAELLNFELARNIHDNAGKALPEHHGRQQACHAVRI